MCQFSHLEKEISRFESQVHLLRGLKHESIVQLVDFKKSANNFYLFLEYCQGGNLAQYIKKRQKLPQSQALKIFTQIIKGLSMMHQFKVVHRDLKPANILLKNGNVKIADFGLACKFSKDQMLKTFAGTPLNMAPQILKGHLYNQKIDIYSAGTLLYEMLYGSSPFNGRDHRALIQAIQLGKLPQTDTEVSDRTRNLLKDMLQPQPQQRINLNQILDTLCAYEFQKIEEKVRYYRRLSKAGVPNLGVIGGISSNLNLAGVSQKAAASDLDLKLYHRLCKKLSFEARE